MAEIKVFLDDRIIEKIKKDRFCSCCGQKIKLYQIAYEIGISPVLLSKLINKIEAPTDEQHIKIEKYLSKGVA